MNSPPNSHESASYRSKYVHNPYHDMHHDPYFISAKYKDGAQCTDCGIVFDKGSFRWTSSLSAKESVQCPACRRIRDRYAGGTVDIEGSFVNAHACEIKQLIANITEKELKEHPLQRLMTVDESPSGIVLATTYEHLARRIGSALERAYGGELEIKYAKNGKFVRVHWCRER